MKLRSSFMLAIALMLSAGCAFAFGAPGSVVVDIVGGKADNTLIATNSLDKIELEIVGGEANNTVIAPPVKPAKVCPCPSYLETCTCTETDYDRQEQRYPWEDMHLGVDAWYGTFWYTDVNMPKWPQF